MRIPAVALAVLLSAGSAAAQEHVLRMGTIVPDGTGWAHELRKLAADVQSSTKGAVRFKYYFGGIAGDEVEMLERIRRGQLDGILSGGMACENIAPSMRVARVPGLFQSWSETSHVIGRLRGQIVSEAQQNGFVFLAEAIVGPSIVFSRRPVATFGDLRSMRFWVWDIDKMLSSFLPAMGVQVLPLPIREAGRAYEDGRVDGFISPAAAALGFQWSTASHHYTELKIGYVVGCLLIVNRTFDALALDQQQAVRVSAAKAKVYIEDVGRAQDAQLVNELFAKQGLRKVPTSESMRVSFFEAARAIREKTAARLISPELLIRVLGMLADYRSEH